MAHNQYEALETDDPAEELEHSFRLLHSCWFLDTYSRCEAKTKPQRAAAKRALAYRDSITREVFMDENPVGSIARAIYNDEPSEDELDALRDLIDEFKDQVESEPKVCGALFPSGYTDIFEPAYTRLGLHGRYWSMNLDLYRGAAPIVPTSTVTAVNFSVDAFGDLLATTEQLSDLHGYMEDEALMQQLFPTPMPSGRRSIPDEWCSRRSHPLFTHEVFWISHDGSCNQRMRNVVVGFARGFGLIDNGQQAISFNQDANPGVAETAWAWMSTSPSVISIIASIVDTLAVLNRRRLMNSFLAALVEISGFAAFFADDLEREVLPKLKPEDRQKLEDAIAVATETPQPTASYDDA